MKNKIALILVFFATISLALYSIFISGTNHAKVVEESQELVEQTSALSDSVIGLKQERKVSLEKLSSIDSLAQEQQQLIDNQEKKIAVLNKEAKLFHEMAKSIKPLKPEIVYIHDTVFITEKKNFWGKTKKSITTTQSIDSVFSEEPVDSLTKD